MTSNSKTPVTTSQLDQQPGTGTVVTTVSGHRLVGRLHAHDLVLAALAFAGPLAATTVGTRSPSVYARIGRQ